MATMTENSKATIPSNETLSPEEWAKVEAMLDAYRPEMDRLQRETHEAQKRTAQTLARIERTLAQIDALLSKW